MKIAMIGSGAAGSVFAAYLRKGGAELWLVDKYKAHMDKIAADGLVFRTPEGEEVLTGFHTSATAHDIGTMDMVILMVKATQTADVMADTMPCIGPETVVVSLQNGLGNDEVLAQFVETDRILYGSGLIGTELAGPGVCVSKPEKGIQMHFGAVHNNPKADAAGKALEACFRAGGCNASFDEDVRPYIWKKVIANSGYNGVSAGDVRRPLRPRHRHARLERGLRCRAGARHRRPLAAHGKGGAEHRRKPRQLLSLHGAGRRAAPAPDGDLRAQRRHRALRRAAERAHPVQHRHHEGHLLHPEQLRQAVSGLRRPRKGRHAAKQTL